MPTNPPRPPSSRDWPDGPRGKDTGRSRREAIAKDADKTEVKDRDKIHGDGTALGLDEALESPVGDRRTS